MNPATPAARPVAGAGRHALTSDVVVIGAGVAGYLAALRLRRAGATVTLVTAGVGGLPLSAGTVDVLGRLGGSAGPSGPAFSATAGPEASTDRDDDARSARRPVTHPYATIDADGELPEHHPYRVIGRGAVARGVNALAGLAAEDGPALLRRRPDTPGEGPANLWLPTAVGAARPSLLTPPSMEAGVLADGARYLVVGLRRLKDLTPELVAGNLARTGLTWLPDGGHVEARAVTVDVEVRDGEHDTSSFNHARALDTRRGRERLARALEGLARDGETILLPAVLGMEDPGTAGWLADRLGAPVAEVPTVPPSVPGMRLEHRLAALATQDRVRVIQGARVVGHRTEPAPGAAHAAGTGERLAAVTVATTGSPREVAGDWFVLAAGGFESGALALGPDGAVTDTVLGLPLVGPDGTGLDGVDWGGTVGGLPLVHPDYWGAPQGLFMSGVAVDEAMRPLAPGGEPVWPNLRAAGGVLAGAVRWSEKSGEGIALGSAWAAADSVLAEAGAGADAPFDATRARTTVSSPPWAGAAVGPDGATGSAAAAPSTLTSTVLTSTVTGSEGAR